MPRDANGNYTLPAGNPVTSGELIESTWANTTLDDVRQAIADSLDRYGRGGMEAAFRFADGSMLAPGIAWQSETGSGIYRAAAADTRLAISGTDRMRWTATGCDIWDGTQWLPVQTGTTGSYLPITGGTLTGNLTLSNNGANVNLLYHRVDAPADQKKWNMAAGINAFGFESHGDVSGYRSCLLFFRSGVSITSIEFGNQTDRPPLISKGEVRVLSSGGAEDLRMACTSTIGTLSVTTGKELSLNVGSSARVRMTAGGQLLGGGATPGGGIWYHNDTNLTGGRVTVSTSAAPATGTPGDIWLQIS